MCCIQLATISHLHWGISLGSCGLFSFTLAKAVKRGGHSRAQMVSFGGGYLRRTRLGGSWGPWSPQPLEDHGDFGGLDVEGRSASSNFTCLQCKQLCVWATHASHGAERENSHSGKLLLSLDLDLRNEWEYMSWRRVVGWLVFFNTKLPGGVWVTNLDGDSSAINVWIWTNVLLP